MFSKHHPTGKEVPKVDIPPPNNSAPVEAENMAQNPIEETLVPIVDIPPPNNAAPVDAEYMAQNSIVETLIPLVSFDEWGDIGVQKKSSDGSMSDTLFPNVDNACQVSLFEASGYLPTILFEKYGNCPTFIVDNCVEFSQDLVKKMDNFIVVEASCVNRDTTDSEDDSQIPVELGSDNIASLNRLDNGDAAAPEDERIVQGEDSEIVINVLDDTTIIETGLDNGDAAAPEDERIVQGEESKMIINILFGIDNVDAAASDDERINRCVQWEMVLDEVTDNNPIIDAVLDKADIFDLDGKFKDPGHEPKALDEETGSKKEYETVDLPIDVSEIKESGYDEYTEESLLLNDDTSIPTIVIYNSGTNPEIEMNSLVHEPDAIPIEDATEEFPAEAIVNCYMSLQRPHQYMNDDENEQFPAEAIVNCYMSLQPPHQYMNDDENGHSNESLFPPSQAFERMTMDELHNGRRFQHDYPVGGYPMQHPDCQFDSPPPYSDSHSSLTMNAFQRNANTRLFCAGLAIIIIIVFVLLQLYIHFW